jgi:tetratricopeptide (TPR) repeat protein
VGSNIAALLTYNGVVGEGDVAQQAHDRAGELINERRFRDAVEPAAEACRLRPDWAAAWSNYCVALKHARSWAACLQACDRAIELDPDDSEGPSWNAGIAATALGDWGRARRYWTKCGSTSRRATDLS